MSDCSRNLLSTLAIAKRLNTMNLPPEIPSFAYWLSVRRFRTSGVFRESFLQRNSRPLSASIFHVTKSIIVTSTK